MYLTGSLGGVIKCHNYPTQIFVSSGYRLKCTRPEGERMSMMAWNFKFGCVYGHAKGLVRGLNHYLAANSSFGVVSQANIIISRQSPWT
jgi:hypothetical protein